MELFITFLKIVEVVIALLLIGIILIQQSKAGGGLSALGGAMTEQFLGATAGNVLTKATVILASVFLLLTLVLAILSGYQRPAGSIIESLETEPGVTEELAQPVTTEEAQSTSAEESPVAVEENAVEQENESTAIESAEPNLQPQEQETDKESEQP